jgi:hypothetical protein
MNNAIFSKIAEKALLREKALFPTPTTLHATKVSAAAAD